MKIHIQERIDLKIKFKYISIILCILVLTACNKEPQVEQKPVVQEAPQKELYLNILTTNKLLYYMVKDVVGEKHYVDYMFTSNNKLWNFSYTDDSINNISRKDMFFYWGSGLEPWMSVFVDKLGTKRVAPVSISRGIKLIEYGRQPKYKETTIADNPYFWVNIDDYKVSMLNIKNSLQDKDSKNRDFYEKNFTKALKEVEDYQKKIKEAAEKLKDFTFVVDGDEMDYFIKYYGFKSIKIYNYGVMPNAKTEEDNPKAEAKFKEVKNLVFLYDNDQKLKANEFLISKYNLKSAGIMVQKDDVRYLDILYNNLRSLESLTITQ
jgi:zinc/manganese transport system substrate-binding protein